MKRVISALVFSLTLTLLSVAPASAVILTEDFEADFPAWESGWLATNSNLQNYYGVGQGRGNNPDGLWIGNTPIIFDSTFGSSITSLDVDVANWTNFSFQAYDMSDNLLLDQPLTPNFGAYSDPGTYWHLSTTSSNGISRLVFNGSGVLGNTSIDNVVVSTEPRDVDSGVVPEPATMALLSSGLFGLLGFKRKSS